MTEMADNVVSIDRHLKHIERIDDNLKRIDEVLRRWREVATDSGDVATIDDNLKSLEAVLEEVVWRWRWKIESVNATLNAIDDILKDAVELSRRWDEVAE